MKDPDRFCCGPDCVPPSLHLRFAKKVLEDNKNLRAENLKIKEERDEARSTFATLDRLRAAEVAKRLEADERVAELQQQLQQALAQAPVRELCPGCEQGHVMCMVCLDQLAVWAHLPCGHRTHCNGCYAARPQPPGFGTCIHCRAVALYDTRIF